MDTDQIRIRDDPRTAQTFNPSDQLHNSWFLFCPLVLIFCENKQINDLFSSFALPASSLSGECCLLKILWLSAPRHLLNDFPLSVCVHVRQ